MDGEAHKWRDMSSAPKDGTEIIAYGVWPVWPEEHGHTPDREGWTGILWDAAKQRWIETKSTGRYYSVFTPRGWFPVPQK